MSTALMPLLEATNLVLQAAEHAPVQAIPAAGNRAAADAQEALMQASRTLQSRGWVFNTEYEFPLPRATDGTVPLPGNLLRLDVDDEFKYQSDPVQRGASLYDRKNRTSSFTRDLKGTVVLLLDWDQLPQPMRYAISLMAARVMQGRYPVSADTYRYTEADVQAAMLGLSDLEADSGDHNMLRDSWSVSSILRERGDVV
jgi:hypothetical protein